jgi:hypothetical protein
MDERTASKTGAVHVVHLLQIKSEPGHTVDDQVLKTTAEQALVLANDASGRRDDSDVAIRRDRDRQLARVTHRKELCAK